MDQPIFELHHLDKIHLPAIQRLARIFPHQLPAIGEIKASVLMHITARKARTNRLAIEINPLILHPASPVATAVRGRMPPIVLPTSEIQQCPGNGSVR
jgi:hypothetical protein